MTGSAISALGLMERTRDSNLNTNLLMNKKLMRKSGKIVLNKIRMPFELCDQQEVEQMHMSLNFIGFKTNLKILNYLL